MGLSSFQRSGRGVEPPRSWGSRPPGLLSFPHGERLSEFRQTLLVIDELRASELMSRKGVGERGVAAGARNRSGPE